MNVEQLMLSNAKRMRRWLVFGVLSLVLAGLFAILVVAARTPGIQNIFPRHDYVKVALVAHVDMSFIVWFAAFEACLWLYVATGFLKRQLFSEPLDSIAFALSVAGTVIMVVSAVLGVGAPVFTNYVPIIDHELFFTGLALLASGVLCAAVNGFVTISKIRRSTGYGDPWQLLRVGVATSTYTFAAAIICFIIALILVGSSLGSAGKDLETVFWGGGHVLQFANTAAMITVWLVVTKILLGEMPVSNAKGRAFFAIFLVFASAAPFIYAFTDIESYMNKRLFTALMEYGLGLTSFVYAVWVVKAFAGKTGKTFFSAIKFMPWSRPEFSAMIVSMLLFALGGVISVTIYGYNTKIPSHYHGEIGGITMAFMGLAYYFMGVLRKETTFGRAARIQPFLYGIGQSLFVIGMFWAGSHGVARKTFGAAQNLDETVKVISMIVFGIGGFVAIAGGVLFIVLALRGLFSGKQSAL